jgi:hypothetical protein
MTVLNPNARPQGYCTEVFREKPGGPGLNTAFMSGPARICGAIPVVED